MLVEEDQNPYGSIRLVLQGCSRLGDFLGPRGFACRFDSTYA